MCRLSRGAAELRRTAAGPVRTLERSQQQPAPFFATVLSDQVDIATVDATWGQTRMAPPAAPKPANDAHCPLALVPDTDPASGDRMRPRLVEMISPGAVARTDCGAPVLSDDRPSPALPAAEVVPAATTVPPMPVTAADLPARATTAVLPAQSDGPHDPVGHGQDEALPPKRVTTRMDQGPDWTLDVMRPRTGAAAAPEA